MIPKTIHYCWFGNNAKSQEMLHCIESWKKLCPDFTIIEWNESNFKWADYPFTKKMYEEKRFAFVADYVRLYVLYEQGGFYLDTDMLLLQSLSSFINNSCVLGEEEENIISAGMVGAEAHNNFILSCKNYYDNHSGELEAIPVVLSKIYKEYEDKSSLTVLPPEAFYPFSSARIKEWHGQDMGPKVYGVHLWNYSWGHPLNKFFMKTGVYHFGKRVTEILGIKKVVKKLLGFI